MLTRSIELVIHAWLTYKENVDALTFVTLKVLSYCAFGYNILKVCCCFTLNGLISFLVLLQSFLLSRSCFYQLDMRVFDAHRRVVYTYTIFSGKHWTVWHIVDCSCHAFFSFLRRSIFSISLCYTWCPWKWPWCMHKVTTTKDVKFSINFKPTILR